MSKWLAGLAAVAVLVPFAWVGTADAADQDVPRVSHARAHHEAARDCGCCGCWQPEYVRHRDVVYRYPDDPRYTLTSEPHYVPGRVYTYVHNWF
jgi:hypothetical protein